MAKIAILGFGVIGSGVFEVLGKNAELIKQKAGQEVCVKYVLDKREPDDPDAKKLLVNNFDVIAEDDEIRAVVEAMGGLEPAYGFARRALSKGVAYITSNKELVARHGQELSALAAENKTNFFFEASVAGGVPVLRTLSEALISDHVTGITGILNGTTNYMLTEMTKIAKGEVRSGGKSFDETLKAAQDLGYTEVNCANDIGGYDTCRKLAILLSMATGRQADYQNIPTEGIAGISTPEAVYSRMLGSTIKLLAMAEITDEGVIASVAPALIPNSHQLSTVADVFNAVYFKGEMFGDIMLYGPGAGKLPTATAVIADIIAAVRHKGICVSPRWSGEPLTIITGDGQTVQKLVRVKYTNRQNAVLAVLRIFGGVELMEPPSLENEFAFVTRPDVSRDLDAKLNELMYTSGVSQIPTRIRLL